MNVYVLNVISDLYFCMFYALVSDNATWDEPGFFDQTVRKYIILN